VFGRTLISVNNIDEGNKVTEEKKNKSKVEMCDV
jgi:hypothetical protein